MTIWECLPLVSVSATVLREIPTTTIYSLALARNARILVLSVWTENVKCSVIEEEDSLAQVTVSECLLPVSLRISSFMRPSVSSAVLLEPSSPPLPKNVLTVTKTVTSAKGPLRSNAPLATQDTIWHSLKNLPLSQNISENVNLRLNQANSWNSHYLWATELKIDHEIHQNKREKEKLMSHSLISDQL